MLEQPRLRHKLFLAFGSVAATLAALEIAMRFNPKASRILVEPSPIPGLGYVMTPDITGISTGDNVLHINKWGFKGADYPKEKPAGVFRIALLGDSVAYGEAGRYDDFAHVLETRLNADPKKPAGTSYQVLNMGVPAYNDCQELVLLRAVADSFSPDLVLVDYTINDPEGVHTPFGVDLKTGRILPWILAYHWVKTHSALVRFVIHELSPTITNLRGQHKVYGPPKVALDSLIDYLKALHDPQGRLWKECAECIRGFGAYQRETKVPVVFLIFPLFNHLELTSIYDQVERETRGAGLATFNLYREVAKLPPREIERYQGDGMHISAEGHVYVGGLLYDLLRPRSDLWAGRGKFVPRP